MRTVDALNTKLNVVVQKLKAWLKKGDQEVMYDSVEMYGELNVSERLRMNDFLPHTKDWNELCAQFFQKKKKKPANSCTTTNRRYWWLITVCFIKKIPLLRAVTPERPHWMGAGDPWAANPCSLWSGREVGNSCGMAWHGMMESTSSYNYNRGVGNLLQEGGLSVRISLPTTTTKEKFNGVNDLSPYKVSLTANN